MLIPFDRYMYLIALQPYRWKFSDKMKLSGILVIFMSQFLRKNDIFAHLNTILGKLGVTHDLGWWLVGKPMFHFLFALTELFSLSITVSELRGKMCTARLFSQGSTSLHSILSGHSHPPSTILGNRKPETLGYPVVKAASFCVPSFWHRPNTGVWPTDGGTDRRISRP